MTVRLDDRSAERYLRLVRAAITSTPRRERRRRLTLALAHEELRRRRVADADDAVDGGSHPRYATVTWAAADRQREYGQLVERILETADAVIPPNASVAVVSRGDPDLLRLEARVAAHFPRAADGAYAGHHPLDGEAALTHLAEHVGTGAEFLVLPATAFWWLEHYAGLAAHLEPGIAHIDADCAIFDLRPT